MKKPNNAIMIPTTKKRFFKEWLKFLYPFHYLTPKEIDVASCFLYHRYELSKSILDNDILDREVLSEHTKNMIVEECEISNAHFQVIMGKLRQKGFIVDGKLEKKFVPNINNEDEDFTLLLYFKLSG